MAEKLQLLLSALGIMTIICIVVYWASTKGSMPWYINAVIAIVSTVLALSINDWRNK
jgi:hypothetical protein